MTAPEMKPCPFCGNQPYIDKATWQIFGCRTWHEYAVACSWCEASTPGDDDADLAMAAWNRRDPDVLAELPEVRALIAAAGVGAAARLEGLWRETSAYQAAQIRAIIQEPKP
jgi:Lar family restriction alleviation protein